MGFLGKQGNAAKAQGVRGAAAEETTDIKNDSNEQVIAARFHAYGYPKEPGSNRCV